MNLLVLMIAVSLSMDAFSLSLAYGMAGVNKKQVRNLSLTVGLFHFFMPLLGMFLGSLILKRFTFDYDFLIFLILAFIGVQMILESFKKKEIKPLKKFEIIMFALAVSIDSFSVGITLTDINENYLISAICFSLASLIFTFAGLSLGNKIAKLVGKLSTIIGGVILVIIGLMFIL